MPRVRRPNKAVDSSSGSLKASDTPDYRNLHVNVIDDENITSSSDEDIDDPVVTTYDIFISDQLKEHLYLLQYPIRSSEEQYYDQDVPYTARMKPKEGTLEVDVPLDQNNISVLRGEKFAGNLQAEHGIKQEISVLERQRLSGKTHENEASYFVGIFRGSMNSLYVSSNFQTRYTWHQ